MAISFLSSQCCRCCLEALSAPLELPPYRRCPLRQQRKPRVRSGARNGPHARSMRRAASTQATICHRHLQRLQLLQLLQRLQCRHHHQMWRQLPHQQHSVRPVLLWPLGPLAPVNTSDMHLHTQEPECTRYVSPCMWSWKGVRRVDLIASYLVDAMSVRLARRSAILRVPKKLSAFFVRSFYNGAPISHRQYRL